MIDPKEARKLLPLAPIEEWEDAEDDPSADGAEDFLIGRTRDERPRVLTVLLCNEHAVEIFQHCSFSYVGMGGSCVGISATERRNAHDLLNIPFNRELARDVLLMSNVATKLINEKAKASNG